MRSDDSGMMVPGLPGMPMPGMGGPNMGMMPPGGVPPAPGRMVPEMGPNNFTGQGMPSEGSSQATRKARERPSCSNA